MEYMREPDQEDIYPSERTVVNVMHAAGGASQADVIAALRYLREDRGLKPGTKNGPRHWALFKTVMVIALQNCAQSQRLNCRLLTSTREWRRFSYGTEEEGEKRASQQHSVSDHVGAWGMLRVRTLAYAWRKCVRSVSHEGAGGKGAMRCELA